MARLLGARSQFRPGCALMDRVTIIGIAVARRRARLPAAGGAKCRGLSAQEKMFPRLPVIAPDEKCPKMSQIVPPEKDVWCGRHWPVSGNVRFCPPQKRCW